MRGFWRIFQKLRLMGEWKEYQIGDLMTLEYGKGLKGYREIAEGVPVFGTNGQIGYTSEALYDKPSVVIGRKGAYREVHYASEPFFVIDTAFYIIETTELTNTKFLYYWFKNVDINKMNSGSAIPSTSRDAVYELPIELPPLKKQLEIAEILSSLDDKIDLLRRQNATLEGLAGALFREWFVENPEEEWVELSLSDAGNFLNGLACQKYPPENEIDRLPVLKIRELKNGITDRSDYSSTSVPHKYYVELGDVIFSWSASLLVKIWDGEDCILNQHLFKVTSMEFPDWYMFFWCKEHLRRFQSISRSQATTMGHIKRKDLKEALVLVPNSIRLNEMDTQMKPIFDRIKSNYRALNTMKLLSGNLLTNLFIKDNFLK